jgi:hypothetical protein
LTTVFIAVSPHRISFGLSLADLGIPYHPSGLLPAEGLMRLGLYVVGRENHNTGNNADKR